MISKTKAEMLRSMGFHREVDRAEHGFCPVCAKPIALEDFRDEGSLREFGISGLCQEDQDLIFGGPD